MEKNNFNTVKNYFSFRECLEILKKDKSKASKGNKCTKAINAIVDRETLQGPTPDVELQAVNGSKRARLIFFQEKMPGSLFEPSSQS